MKMQPMAWRSDFVDPSQGLHWLHKLNPFRPATMALLFALCLAFSLDATRLPQSLDLHEALDLLDQHALSTAELESGVGQVNEMIARDYPNPGPLAKPVTIIAATSDPIEYLLTLAYRLLTFSTLDPIRNSVTSCLEDGEQAYPQGFAALSAAPAGRCNVALPIPAKQWIAQSFREGEALAFTLRHELGHAVFLDYNGGLIDQLHQYGTERAALIHSVMIESEADAYVVLKTAQRNGTWSGENMLDGLIKFRRVQPQNASGASIGTHDTTDALASLDANRQWIADAVGAADAAIVRQAEQIAIAGIKAYVVRNGFVVTEKLNRVLGARQALLASPALDQSLGKLSVSVERAPLYAAVFASDGTEPQWMAQHPLLNVLLWCILWTVWLRAGWMSIDFMLRQIAQSGRPNALAATRFSNSSAAGMVDLRPQLSQE
jgi:hypothetical protein